MFLKKEQTENISFNVKQGMFSVYIKQKVCVDSYMCDEFDTHRCFLVNRFYDKLLVIERDVSDLTPGEANLWRQPEKKKEMSKSG